MYHLDDFSSSVPSSTTLALWKRNVYNRLHCFGKIEFLLVHNRLHRMQRLERNRNLNINHVEHKDLSQPPTERFARKMFLGNQVLDLYLMEKPPTAQKIRNTLHFSARISNEMNACTIYYRIQSALDSHVSDHGSHIWVLCFSLFS